MRHLGILDETDPANPSLIIPNYIDSPSQLISTSDTFALTCMDECEQILAQVEDQIQAPYAVPERVAAAVAYISSNTQAARPDGFSPMMMFRLEEIARVDSGQDGTRSVSLHGRLFAEWLHHAFPRECPQPYYSGDDVQLILPSEFNKLKGRHAAHASKDEMKAYADKAKDRVKVKHVSSDEDEELPWSEPKEELLIPRHTPSLPLVPDFHQFAQAAVCIGVLIMLLPNLALIRGVRSRRFQLSKALARPDSVVASKLL